MNPQIKRVYDPPAKTDGKRILVDRLWPRGLTREKAAVDLWLREIAPSNELRQRYRHDPEQWPEFRERYFEELDRNPELVGQLRREIDASATLLFAAKDTEYNNARALLEYLLER